MTRFARFAWTLLAYDVAVAAWGTYVRATGSGAGCGRHWPLCNGEVVPRAPRVDTLVELSHRLTSGTALVATAVLLVWAWRAYPKGDPVRGGAVAAAAFMAAEALIGAALVLFALVAHDESAARAVSVSLHLVNTFLLLASTALTAWWSSGGAALRLREQGIVLWSATAPLLAVIIVGISGALTALGDTLFPASSVASGLAADFARGGHVLVHLRTIHPVIAAATAALIVIAASVSRVRRPTRAVGVLSRAAVALALAQVCAGLLDVATLAPIWVQMAHLVLAHAVWIALVLGAAAALSRTSEAACRPSRLLPPDGPGLPGLRARPVAKEGEA